MPVISKKNYGFTLVELMVVVAIVGILASIAIPSYRNYVIKSKTSEATSNLLQMAALQEQFYRDYRVYAFSAGTAAAATFSAATAIPPNAYNKDGAIAWSSANNKYFTYSFSTTNDGQAYAISATGTSAEGTGDYRYAINSNNVMCMINTAGSTLTLASTDTSCPTGASVW